MLLFLSLNHTNLSFAFESAQMDTKVEIFSVIKKVINSLPLDPDRISQIINVNLHEDVTQSDDYFSVKQGHSVQGSPFADIELRTPQTKATVPDGLIILVINESNRIKKDDMIDQFGQPKGLLLPTPQEPKESPLFYIYNYVWGSLKFGFDRDNKNYLKKVIIDATEQNK